jgi:hypothetical protein
VTGVEPTLPITILPSGIVVREINDWVDRIRVVA